MFGTSARSGFRRGCGRASWRPPSDLVDQAHDSGALTDACTRKGPQMANPRPTPKPENLRPPWPPGTSGNPAGYSRERLLVSVLFSPKKELTPITGCNALRSGHFGRRKGATKSVFFRAAGLVSAFSERRFRKVFCRAGEAQLVSAQPTEPTSLASVGCTHPIGGKPAFSTIIHARDSVKKI